MDSFDPRGPRDRRPLDRADPDGRDEERTRVRWSLRPATKVTSLIGLSLVAVAVYYLLAPVFMETGNGWFPCGSAWSGPDDEFTANTCRGATDAHLAKSLLFAALALIVGVGGVVLFGADPITETREMARQKVDETDRGRQREDPRSAKRERRRATRAERPRSAPDAWGDDGWR